MLNIRGKKSKDIEKEVYRILKEKRLNDRFTAIVNLDKEFVVPENNNIIVNTTAGSNEGWYVSIICLDIESIINYTTILSFRVQESLDSTIAIRNELVKNIYF